VENSRDRGQSTVWSSDSMQPQCNIARLVGKDDTGRIHRPQGPRWLSLSGPVLQHHVKIDSPWILEASKSGPSTHSGYLRSTSTSPVELVHVWGTANQAEHPQHMQRTVCPVGTLRHETRKQGGRHYKLIIMGRLSQSASYSAVCLSSESFSSRNIEVSHDSYNRSALINT
jgi:hypothetical protein